MAVSGLANSMTEFCMRGCKANMFPQCIIESKAFVAMPHRKRVSVLMASYGHGSSQFQYPYLHALLQMPCNISTHHGKNSAPRLNI